MPTQPRTVALMCALAAVLDFAGAIITIIVLAEHRSSVVWYRIVILVVVLLAGIVSVYNCLRWYRIHRLQAQVAHAAATQLPSYYASQAPPPVFGAPVR
ncbi:hypothetical protein C8F01DRAFT_1167024 [Mycena amicta]|nr:hypothetical protein C8F01DRAFT_1167024 [Mycena amicta]